MARSAFPLEPPDLPEGGGARSERPRRVLYVTPTVSLLGARFSLYYLVTSLDRDRYEPLVVVPHEGELTAILRRAGVPVRRVTMKPYRKLKGAWSHPLAFARLRRLAREVEADLVHANEFWSNPFAVAAGRAVGAPVVTHLRLTIPERKVRIYKLHRASRIVAVSRATARQLSSLPDWQIRSEVIYNGVDLRLFAPSQGQAPLRRDFGIPPDAPLLGIVGQISPRKGHDVLMGALSRLGSRAADWHLVVIGEEHACWSAYRQALEEQIRASGWSRRVHFTGFRRDVARIMAAIDLLVVPSREEGFGRVIIEAQAMERPVVCSDSGGMPEVLADGETGLIFPSGDEEALARHLVSLIENRPLRRRMGRSGRRRVQEHFSIEAHAQKIQELYDRLLAHPADWRAPRHRLEALTRARG